MIEDSEDDALLLILQLERAGYAPQYRRVDTDADMKDAISSEPWDIIISDYFMPQYDVLEAIDFYKKSGLDIPFIVVSGTLGEEYAVNVIKKGAHDFLRKNNPARLVASVQRELRDAEERRALRRAEEEKRQMQQAIQISEERYSEIFNSVNDAIFILEIGSGAVIDVNERACEIYGYTREELLASTVEMRSADVPPYTGKEAIEWIQRAAGGEPQIFEWHARNKSGRLFWVEVSMKRSDIGGVSRIFMTIRDITSRKDAEKALRDSEEKIRAVVEASPAPIMWAVEGKIEFINRKFVELFGYTLEDIPTMEDWLLHTCPDFGYREAVRILWSSILEEEAEKEGASSIEVAIACKDGTLRFVNMAGARIGSMLLAIFSDLTERKRAEEDLLHEKEFSDAVIDSIPGLFYFFDEKGNFVRWSRIQEEVMGYTAEEASFITIKDTIVEEDRERIDDLAVQVFSKGRSATETSLITKDGRRIPYYLTGVRVALTGRTYIVGVGIDISERKKAEEVTIKAMESAERASRAKSEFLAHMSHEIRTPMNGIIGLTTLLLNSELTTIQREYLNMVKISAGNLLGIINEILEMSRIEAHRIELVKTNFHLREALAETLKMQKQFAEQKGLVMSYTIAGDVPDALHGDIMKLHQVILNIISNAVKFTQKGHVDFSVKVAGTEPGGIVLHFSVSDTGCGIPESMQQDIFEPFKKGESSFTRTHDSIGLGLAICRDLVSLMDGKIWVESAPGLGSTFHFTVLLEEQKPTSEKDGKSPEKIESCASSLTLLVAEDEVINRRVIVDYLTSLGHKVFAVDNGKKVLDALEKDVYDVVLMDIRMPVMNGLEATEIIRRKDLERGGHQHIIAMTAYAMKDDLERFIEAGMDSCITKPLDMEDLENVLRELSVKTSLERQSCS